jgi:hypothetical protein
LVGEVASRHAVIGVTDAADIGQIQDAGKTLVVFVIIEKALGGSVGGANFYWLLDHLRCLTYLCS